MYDYTVHPDVSEKLFYEQCRKIDAADPWTQKAGTVKNV